MNGDEKQLNQGLRELPPDTRDFSLGAVFDLPKLEDLPAQFLLEPLSVKDQGSSDLCTAYATCGMSELQEGVELCPEYSFALGKEISGDPDAWGQDMRTAMKGHVKFGAIEQNHCYVEGDGGIDPRTQEPNSELRRIENWAPQLKEQAVVHAKRAFFSVDGPYDAFDDIRAALWRFRDEKRGVGLGVLWSWPLSQVVMKEPGTSNFGHMVYAIGWITSEEDGKPYLVIQNSAGESAGVKGRHYFSREVVNRFVVTYGAFMFVDLTKEEYLERIRPQIRSKLQVIIAALAEFAKSLAEWIAHDVPKEEAKPPPLSPLAPEPMVLTPVTPAPVDYRVLARNICIEEGLSAEMTERLLKTVELESNFDPNAKNRNPNGTYDHGIAQLNDYWYIGPGKPCPSVEKAYDPDFSLRLMARQFKSGRARDWIVYRKLFGASKVAGQLFGSMTIPNWLLSSSGEGVALRWKAVASAVIPTAVIVLAWFGYSVTSEDADAIVKTGERGILALWELASVWMFISGLARRNWNKQHSVGKFGGKELA